MRKRVFLGPVVAIAVAFAAFTGGAPAAPGKGGPPCTDIASGGVNFPSSTTGTYTLRFQMRLAAPACIGKITYKLFVVYNDGTSEVTAEATLTGFSTEGYPQFEFSSSDTTICVYGTTSSKTGHLYDRAPDAGSTPDCLALLAGGPGGGSGFS